MGVWEESKLAIVAGVFLYNCNGCTQHQKFKNLHVKIKPTSLGMVGDRIWTKNQSSTNEVFCLWPSSVLGCISSSTKKNEKGLHKVESER